MQQLSALGDTALLAPASLGLLIYLLAIRRWADARAFAFVLALGLGATLVSKLLFKACGGFIDIVHLQSPSGHASFATLFYGCLALLLGAGRSRAWVALLALFTALLVVAIGASRPLQGHHSWAEVVFGWLIGLGGLLAFRALRPSRSDRPLSPLPLLAGFALALLLLGGRHFTPERHIGRIARAASASLDVCRAPAVTELRPDHAMIRR